jgi:hypothetical protein
VPRQLDLSGFTAGRVAFARCTSCTERKGMTMRQLLAATFALAVAIGAQAEGKCAAKGVMGGKKFSMSHCAVSYYDDEHSVTIWFSETPISTEEAKTFQVSAYPLDRDVNGKPRTMLHLAFCPGGGQPSPRPEAVKSVEFWMNHADSPMLSRQWVLQLPKDKELKLEKLSGDLKLGGGLAGRVTGGKTSDGLLYSWEIDFDVPLPNKSASAGVGCGPHD